MKTKRLVFVKVDGYLLGHIWNGSFSELKIDEHKKDDEDLITFIKRICKSGDFQDCKLSSDTDLYIVIDFYRQKGLRFQHNHRRCQWINVKKLPSIKEFVSDKYSIGE